MKLDIGCGPSKVGRNCIGLDLSRGPCVDVVGSADALPFKSDSFTYVFTRRCVQHVKNDRRVLSEIYRVLEKNGKLRLVVASWRGWLYYQAKWFLRRKPYELFHVYTSGKLKRMFQEAGFHLMRIDRVSSVRRFGYDIVIEARKE